MEILSAFTLFPGGKMLLRSEGERDEFYFPDEKKNCKGNNFFVFK